MRYLLIFLIFSSCTLSKKASEAVDQRQANNVTVLSQDTLFIALPDSLKWVVVDKQIKHVIAARKIKNKGTIIIQTGAGSVASAVGKAKAPVAVAAHDAVAIEKPKNSAVTTGPNSPATATTEKAGFPWWILLVLAAAGHAYHNYKKA